jgi:hypothetical protein
MKSFHCDHCQQLVVFENTQCVNCGHTLAYLPDRGTLIALVPAGDGSYRGKDKQTYRLCKNYKDQNVCNWAVPVDSPTPYCRSCQFTRTIPDLSRPGHRLAWAKLETAKRRLLYTLLSLNLPLATRVEEPEIGLAFEFLADPADAASPVVLTGHADGVITMSVAEADDPEREKRRVSLHEPYRTLLGHFRHEIGHYYWDRLIKNSDHLDDFRQLFGDEQQDYDAALKRHYAEGPRPDWQEQYVSAYASTHPWEDWAETWAHYLHMTDTTETAVDCGLTLRPKRADEPSLKPDPKMAAGRSSSFDKMLEGWFALTYVLNNLNRGMGLADAYPFVLSDAVVEKLWFIHDVVSRGTQPKPAVAGVK